MEFARFDLIFVPYSHYDETKTLLYPITSICLINADGEQQAFKPHWCNWEPSKPHLLVVDYVIGQERAVGEMLGALSERTDLSENQVLVLLLERQRWVRDRIQKAPKTKLGERDVALDSGARARWFEIVNDTDSFHDLSHPDFRHGDGVIELGPLKGSTLISIVECMCPNLSEKMKVEETLLRLAQIDGTGSPLFAYFLGEAIREGSYQSHWSRVDLLDDALTRDQKRRWKHYFSEVPHAASGWTLSRDNLACKIATLATMANSISRSELREFFLAEEVTDKVIRQAQALTGTPIRAAPLDECGNVVALEPDLLGEWFVMKAVTEESKYRAVVASAWRHDPRQMGAFLIRAVQDFPAHPAISVILTTDTPNELASAVFSQISSELSNTLLRADLEIPETLLRALDTDSKRDPHVLNNLGAALLRSRQGESSKKRAFDCFREAAARGSIIGKMNLGSCYLNGWGVAKDTGKAIDLLRDAQGENDDPDAGYLLAMAYLNSHNDPEGTVLALPLLESAASARHLRASLHLGAIRAQKTSGHYDFDRAIQLLEFAASHDEIEPMYSLGQLYAQADGENKDWSKALVWFERAANHQHVESMYCLGFYHSGSLGHTLEIEPALKWLNLAARNGHLAAKQLAEALVQRQARDESPDYSNLSLKELESLAASGNTEAAFVAGMHHLKNADENPLDAQQTLRWWRLAAQEKHPNALYHLSCLYMTGTIVEQDIRQGLELMIQAHQNGCAEALEGLIYFDKHNPGIISIS